MSRIEVEVEIAAAPSAVFGVMTDPARMARWLPHTEAIEDPSGPIEVAGTTFTQRGAPGMRRPGATVAADPPRSWQLRLAGFGERVDAAFSLDDLSGSTLVRLDARVDNGPALLAPVINRLALGLDRKSWSTALSRLKAEVERTPAAIHLGTVYSLNSGAGVFRVGQLLAADPEHVHLRLYGQRFTKRPGREDLAELGVRLPRHYAEIVPLPPTLKGVLSGGPGVAWLLADGGFGLPHVPVSRAAFGDAEPEPLLDAGVAEEHLEAIAAWRARRGMAFGDTPEPSVGAYLSVAVEGNGFGIVKLLRSELRGVHVRAYSNVFAERPLSVDEASLESAPPAEARPGEGSWPPKPFAVGHLPLSHPAFARWKPQVVSMALVDAEELLGYEEWKLAKGGFF